MSTFNVTMEVGHPDGGDRVGVSAAVDTGSFHTLLPESLLTQMRIQPRLEQGFRFADGNEMTLGVGFCRIVLPGYDGICPVVFGPEDKYLLGATTLEIFSLAADPVNHMLLPVIREVRPI